MSRAKHIRRFHQTTVAPAPARTEVCEFCAKTFVSSTKLRSHVQKSHSNASSGGQPKVQCDMCAKWMSNKVALAIHMKRHESNPQKCPHCAKVSPNDKALDQHIRTVHVQQAKYKCHLCDKAFKVATVLKVSGCRFVRQTICLSWDNFLWANDFFFRAIDFSLNCFFFLCLIAYIFLDSFAISVGTRVHAYRRKGIQMCILSKDIHLAIEYVRTPEESSYGRV